MPRKEKKGQTSKNNQQTVRRHNSTSNVVASGAAALEPQPGPSRESRMMAFRSCLTTPPITCREMTPFHSYFRSPSAEFSPGIPRRQALTRCNVRSSKHPIPVKNFNEINPSYTSTTISSRARRRSKSWDSLASTPVSVFGNTFDFQPGISRSKSSERLYTATKRSFQSGTSGHGKTIRKPDPEAQMEMAKYVVGFLNRHDCPARTSHWKELTTPARITTSSFFGMIKFVASFLVGEDYFVNGKDEEKTVEVAKLLQYPGSVSKSHLITPTAQHAWPGHLTLLSWLCCRVEALHEPENDQSTTFHQADSGFRTAFLPSLTRLFLHHNQGFGIALEVEDEAVDAEVKNFRETVAQLNGPEGDKTQEELVREKEELTRKLEQLNNEPDPTAELKGRLIDLSKRYESLRESRVQAQRQFEKYSDQNCLLIEKQDLEMQIENKKMEIRNLEQQVKSQPLSHETAALVKAETSDLKRQVQAVKGQNARLKLEMEKKIQELENMKRMFSDVCEKFYIVRQYNEFIESLNLGQFTVTPNPFHPNELRKWLKKTLDTMQNAQEAVKHLMKQAGPISKQQKKAAEQLANLCKQIEEYKEKLGTQEADLSFISHELELKYKEESEKVAELRKEVEMDEEHLRKLKLTTPHWMKSLAEGNKLLNNWNQTLVQECNKVKDELAKHKLEETELSQHVNDLLVYAVQRQQEFYQEAYGVDSLEEHVDENMNEVE